MDKSANKELCIEVEQHHWWIHSYKFIYTHLIYFLVIEFQVLNSRSALVVNINIQSFPLFNPFCYFTLRRKRLNISAWWLMLRRHPEPVKLTTSECWWVGGEEGLLEGGWCMGKTHMRLEWSHGVKEQGEKRRPSIRRASVRPKHHKQVWVSVSLKHKDDFIVLLIVFNGLNFKNHPKMSIKIVKKLNSL